VTERTRPGEGSVGSLLFAASNAVRARLSDALRGLGLDHDMWVMMQNIKVAGEAGADPVEVASEMRMSKGALIDAAERLVRDGWARPMSRRATGAVRLMLTKKGEEALPGLDSTGAFILEHATNGLTRDEIEALARYLKTIIENMGASA
jgi:DNA-binding MarR family transcriptional regulator